MNRSSGIIVAAVVATAAPWLVAPAAAAPVSSLTGPQNNTMASSIETVQYHRGGYGYRGRRFGGLGLGLGLGAGALIGGAIVGAPQPYYGRYGYGDYDPGYYSAPPDEGGDEVAYCQQRFRSYDPDSGTYLGFDGMRHPCP